MAPHEGKVGSPTPRNASPACKATARPAAGLNSAAEAGPGREGRDGVDARFRCTISLRSIPYTTPWRKATSLLLLIVTTGLRDELPEVLGVAQRWGRKDVLQCPYCHGSEVRDALLACWPPNRLRCIRHCWSGSGRPTLAYSSIRTPLSESERETADGRGHQDLAG